MKARINENGTLVIKPENGTECFALRKWEENFKSMAPDEGDSSLTIDANLPEKKIKKKKGKNKDKIDLWDK